MIQRCTNPRKESFSNYGGRGIVVCQRWLSSFDAFVADVGPRPSLSHSLDRIDVNGNYEPGNVRWATTAEQGRNKRTNVWLEHDCVRMTAADWAAKLGISRESLAHRIRSGWTVEEICTTPGAERGTRMRRIVPGSRKYTVDGITDSVAGWSRRLGITHSTLTLRLMRGLPPERVFTSVRPLRARRPKPDHVAPGVG